VDRSWCSSSSALVLSANRRASSAGLRFSKYVQGGSTARAKSSIASDSELTARAAPLPISAFKKRSRVKPALDDSSATDQHSRDSHMARQEQLAAQEHRQCHHHDLDLARPGAGGEHKQGGYRQPEGGPEDHLYRVHPALVERYAQRYDRCHRSAEGTLGPEHQRRCVTPIALLLPRSFRSGDHFA
jgi:hypothetical protein